MVTLRLLRVGAIPGPDSLARLTMAAEVAMMTAGGAMSRETAHQVVGRLPSGCCIATARHAGRATGMLASWIQQAAMDPVLMSLAVRRGRPILDLAQASGRVVLNVLPEDPATMFKHFGRGFGPEEDAFSGLRTRLSEYGVELLDTIGSASCQLVSTHTVGDHELLILEPVTGMLYDDQPPYVHIRKSATSY